MRAVTLGLLMLALLDPAAPALAGPAEKVEPQRPMPPPESRAILSPRDTGESLERQAAFDRQVAQRSQRAARSICTGCGAGTGARGSAVTPGLRNPIRDEAGPADPAEAPRD